MITATQARNNTINTRDNLAAQTKERARLFCENKISPLITAVSKDGEDHVLVDIDENININEVKLALFTNHFEVCEGTGPRSISIMW